MAKSLKVSAGRTKFSTCVVWVWGVRYRGEEVAFNGFRLSTSSCRSRVEDYQFGV